MRSAVGKYDFLIRALDSHILRTNPKEFTRKFLTDAYHSHEITPQDYAFLMDKLDRHQNRTER